MKNRLFAPQKHLRQACFALGLGLLLAAAGAAWADDVLPIAFPAARYQKLSAHSPFSPPTIAAPVTSAPIAPAGSWSDKLTVTLLMQQGGKYVAMLLDRDSSEHFLVTSDTENNRNMMLSSVQWSDQLKQTRVTIRKGKEFGQVAFDPNATAAAPSSAPGLPGAISRPSPVSPGPGAGPALFHPPPGSVGGRGPQSPPIVRRPTISANPPPAIPTPRIAPGGVAIRPQDDSDDDDDDN